MIMLAGCGTDAIEAGGVHGVRCVIFPAPAPPGRPRRLWGLLGYAMREKELAA